MSDEEKAMLPGPRFRNASTTEIYTLSLHDALPILNVYRCTKYRPLSSTRAPNGIKFRVASGARRSEERRVGKEWRWGGGPYYLNNNDECVTRTGSHGGVAAECSGHQLS